FLPHYRQRVPAKQVDGGIYDGLPQRVNQWMKDGSIDEHDVRDVVGNFQILANSVRPLGQNDVCFVKPLRIVVANAKQGSAVGNGVGPENLVHRQLAQNVGVG